MDLFIREVAHSGLYDTFFDGQLLCRRSQTPLLTSARTLLALGYSPDIELRMVRWGREPSIVTTVGIAGNLEIGMRRTGMRIWLRRRSHGPASCRQEAAA